MITSWFSLLERAKSIAEVIRVMRDFLATFTPAELALLPPACRPGRLRDEHDLEALHVTLVEEYRGSRATGGDLDVLQRLTTFVVRASVRVAELGETSPGTSGSPGGSQKSAARRET